MSLGAHELQKNGAEAFYILIYSWDNTPAESESFLNGCI